MSGLEVAGVVLGALPLVIAALEQYTQGIHTAKRYWRYKPELRSLTVQIRTEHRIYVNTLEQLLTGIVRIEHMSELLSNPDGDAWRDVQLNNSMKERLSDAYDVYFDNVRAMSAALKKIMEELALDPDGKVQPGFNDPSRFRYEYKRLKFSLSKSKYAGQLNSLKNHNQSLSSLTKQSLDLEPTRAGGKTRTYPNFKALQGYARDFHHLLRLSLQRGGSCLDHAVNLRLENRCREAGEEDLPDFTLFRVIFTHVSNEQSQWKEADIRCIFDAPQSVPFSNQALGTNFNPFSRKRKQSHRLNSSLHPVCSATTTMTQPQNATNTTATLSQIHDLCGTMRQLSFPTARPCIGYLLDDENRKYGIYPCQHLSNGGQLQWSSYSLQQVLTEQVTTGVRLTQTDKLRIALYLASSVLQLYKTPWLDDQWGHKDVYFVQRPGATLAEVSRQPFIFQKLSATVSTPAIQTRPTYSVIRNQTLFALGILLIELWYGKPIEELAQDPDLNCQGTPGIFWCTAERLVKTDIPFEAGAQYADVVRRCIRCDFDRTDTDLDSEEFQKAVFDRVVVPLNKTLKQFSGYGLDVV